MSDSENTTETLATQLASFATSATYDTLPEAVCESVRMRVLDTVGVSLGALPLDTSRMILDYVNQQQGKLQAHALGLKRKTSPALAALANGVLAHSLDFDDTHLPSIIHPSASVVPTSLAVGEALNSSGKDVIAAIAVGLEVTVRIGMAGYDADAGNSKFFEHGQHATSICGALGSAVAASLLLGATKDEIRNVLGIVASMSAGIIEANRTGGTVKRLHCGWAAHSAVTAAELVRAGFTGPPTVFEGRFGFFEAFLHGHFDAIPILDGLGTAWVVPDIFFKPYPANHFTHTAVDAGRMLRDKGIDVADIASLTLGVPGPVIRTIGEPIAEKQAPQTGYQAQFSGPFAVATGLLGGNGLGAGLDDYTDELAFDPARRSVMSRVTFVEDGECNSIYPEQFPSVLTARMMDGTVHVIKALANRGGSALPLTQAELTGKFINTASRSLSAETAAQTADWIAELHTLDTIAPQLAELADRIHLTD